MLTRWGHGTDTQHHAMRRSPQLLPACPSHRRRRQQHHRRTLPGLVPALPPSGSRRGDCPILIRNCPIRLQFARRSSRQFKLPAVSATTTRARRTSAVPPPPPAQHLASLLFSCCFVSPTLLTNLQFPLSMIIHALAGANPSWSILSPCTLNGLIRPFRTPFFLFCWAECWPTPRRPRTGDCCSQGRSICTRNAWPAWRKQNNFY